MPYEQADERFLKTLSVLYVEDDADTRRQGARFLSRRVGTLLTAESAEQGLALFRESKPDIVATDLQMPGMGGLNLAATVRRESPRTPVVVVTAFETTDYLRGAIDAEVDQYVVKPVDPALFERALGRAARKVRAERELVDTQHRVIESAAERERAIRELFDASAVGIVSVDERTGKAIRVNAGLCEMLGYAEAELMQMRWDALQTPEEARESAALLARLRSGDLPALHVERRYRKKDGTELIAQVTVTRLPATPACPDGRRLVVVADVTARSQHETRRLRSQQNEVDALKVALRDAEALPPLVSMCMHCKNVRDEQDHVWRQLPDYLERHTHTRVSHGLCEACARRYYGEYVE